MLVVGDVGWFDVCLGERYCMVFMIWLVVVSGIWLVMWVMLKLVIFMCLLGVISRFFGLMLWCMRLVVCVVCRVDVVWVMMFSVLLVFSVLLCLSMVDRVLLGMSFMMR